MRNALEFAVAGQRVELVDTKCIHGFLEEVVDRELTIDRVTKAQVVVKMGDHDVYFRKHDGRPGNSSSFLVRGMWIRMAKGG